MDLELSDLENRPIRIKIRLAGNNNEPAILINPAMITKIINLKLLLSIVNELISNPERDKIQIRRYNNIPMNNKIRMRYSPHLKNLLVFFLIKVIVNVMIKKKNKIGR